MEYYLFFTACECDPRGSSDGGRCYAKSDAESNLVAGSCHCKSNVTGIRCDQCVKDYWNLNISHETGCISKLKGLALNIFK